MRAVIVFAIVGVIGGGCRGRRATPARAADAGAGTVTTGVMAIELPVTDGGLAPDAQRYRSYRDQMNRTSAATVDRDPASVRDFGYKIGWIAVPTSDATALVAQLGVGPAVPTPFAAAMDAAYDGRGTFITPTFDGWTLIVGSAILEAQLGELEGLLVELSREHGEAQAFLTHRVFEYHGYLQAREGRIVRAYVYDGEAKGVLRDVGARQPEEAGLPTPFGGPAFMTPAGMVTDGRLPAEARQEADVIHMAAAWSIDPLTLSRRPRPEGQALLAAPLALEHPPR